MSDTRLCYNCKHIDFDTGEPDWSDVTPGSNGHLGCNLNHWYIQFRESHYYGENEPEKHPSLAECLETAIQCTDYVHSELAESLLIPAPAPVPHVQPRCHKCTSTLEKYYDPESWTSYTHCPVCSPVVTVTTDNGKQLWPEEVK